MKDILEKKEENKKKKEHMKESEKTVSSTEGKKGVKNLKAFADDNMKKKDSRRGHTTQEKKG